MSGRLSELKPRFLKRAPQDGRESWQSDVPFEEADGIIFLCPKCFQENNGPVGTHSIICWRPGRVPDDLSPGPGRWDFQGTGIEDLTLIAKSSSIQLTSGCRWHGYIRGGQWSDA